MMFWLVAFILFMWVIYLPTFYLLLREQLIARSQDETKAGHKIFGLLACGRTSYSEEDRRQDHRRVRILLSACPWACILWDAARCSLFSNRLCGTAP
jgi:hypothetical protein